MVRLFEIAVKLFSINQYLYYFLTTLFRKNISKKYNPCYHIIFVYYFYANMYNGKKERQYDDILKK